MVDITFTMLGNTILRLRDEATSLLSMLTELKQSFVSAPFAMGLLFDRKPISAVVYKTEQDNIPLSSFSAHFHPSDEEVSRRYHEYSGA